MSLTIPRKFRTGTIMLTIACLLIFTESSRGITFVGHFVALAILYISLGSFAAGAKYKKIPGMEPGVNAAVVAK